MHVGEDSSAGHPVLPPCSHQQRGVGIGTLLERRVEVATVVDAASAYGGRGARSSRVAAVRRPSLWSRNSHGLRKGLS